MIFIATIKLDSDLDIKLKADEVSFYIDLGNNYFDLTDNVFVCKNIVDIEVLLESEYIEIIAFNGELV